MIDDSFMALSLTQSLAERAIDSIKLGGRREIRNALDLFKSFFTRLGIDYVPFYRARYIQSFRVNPDSLVKRMVMNVNKENLKSFIVNTIYSVFTNGALLKESNTDWIIDLTESNSLDEDILKYNSQGAYAFFINADIRCDSELFRVINAHPKSVFFLYSDKYSKKVLNFDYKSENICYFLSVLAYNNIGTNFLRNKLLFGIIKNGSREYSLEKEISELKAFDRAGVLFVSYYSSDMRLDNELYNDILKIRKDLDLSMVCLSLNGLFKRIQKKLLEEAV